jgi:tripartite-type tricarboxylate transporter receptor subunit TctC
MTAIEFQACGTMSVNAGIDMDAAACHVVSPVCCLERAVEKRDCDDEAGNAKDVCVAKAKAVEAKALAEEGINIQMISTSEIKIAVVIDEKYMELAVRALQKVFEVLDGFYTFLMGTPGTQAINQFLYPKMPYDTDKDLIPVSYVTRVPNVMVVPPSLGVKTMDELIKLARSKPGKLTYGSPGNGSTGQLSTELFKTRAKVFVTHIPYRGSAPMLQDLLGGQIDMSIDNLPSALPHIKSGRLIALGVTSAAPNAQLPDVKPIGVSLPGYEAESWFVLVAPRGTPEAIVTRLSAEVDRILKKPDVIERFRGLGAEPVGGTPADLARHIASETTKWREVVKTSGAMALIPLARQHSPWPITKWLTCMSMTPRASMKSKPCSKPLQVWKKSNTLTKFGNQVSPTNAAAT